MKRVLVTGADGYLGRRIAQRLLETTDEPVTLWMRAADAEEARAKRRRLEPFVGRHPSRIAWAFGDLGDPEPFAEVSPSEHDAILHCAAVTRFDVEREVAERVNVKGTAAVLAFAERCPQLRALDHLSSLYATGLAAGDLPEARVPEPEFANHYEWSKWAAEELLHERADLPWRIHRVGTVLCDDASGRVSQVNVVHRTIRLLHGGLLPVVPGKDDTRLYLVTRDFAAAAVLGLRARAPTQRCLHICDPEDRALALGPWIDRLLTALAADPEFARRRILRPLLTDFSTFELLSSSAQDLSPTSSMGSAMGVMRPFAPQLFVSKRFETASLRELLPSLTMPDPAALVTAICDQLRAGGWQPGGDLEPRDSEPHDPLKGPG